MSNKVCHCREGSSDKVYIVSIEKDAGHFVVTAKNGRIYKSMKTHPKGRYGTLSEAQVQQSDVFTSKTGKATKPYTNIESPAYDGPLSMQDSWLKEHLVQDLTGTALENEEWKWEAASLLLKGKGSIAVVRHIRAKTKWHTEKARDFVKNVEKEIDENPEAFEHLREEVNADDIKAADVDMQKLREAAIVLVEAGKKIKAVTLVQKKIGGSIKDARDAVNRWEEVARAAASMITDWEVVCVNALGMEDSFDEGVEYIAEKHPEEDMIYVYDRNGEKQECFSERFKEGVTA